MSRIWGGGGSGPSLFSARIYAEGYWCYATLYIQITCGAGLTASLNAAPFGSDAYENTIATYGVKCAEVWSVATPNPTKHPSESSTAPTRSAAPTIAPTSSCLDYNNETSSHGKNEIRE
eukprot:547964_1